jgi:DNA polymerase-1
LCQQLGPRPVYTTVYPIFAIRKPQWKPVVKQDIWRALSKPEWNWPRLITQPGKEMSDALKEMYRMAKQGREPHIGVDIENIGDPVAGAPIRCIGLATLQTAVSIPTEVTNEYNHLIQAILESPATKVLHNAQHDILGLEAQGWRIHGPYYDTLLAHAVIAPQLPHGLSDVASFEYHAPRWKSEFKVLGDDKGVEHFKNVSLEDLCLYNAKDAYMTVLLAQRLRKQLKDVYNGKELLEEQHQLAAIAVKMRRKGVEVNRKQLSVHEASLSEQLGRLRERFAARVPSHTVRGAVLKTRTKVYVGPYRLGAVGGHSDLKKLFFKHYGCRPTRYTEQGEPVLDKEALSKIVARSIPVIGDVGRLVLKYRELGKLLSTYIQGLPVHLDGCIHPTWKCYGTVTGRWSSQEPNGQNIPKKMRDLFKTRKNKYLVQADYSQLELRIIALLSGDKLLLKWYNEGLDVHTITAESVLKRTPTKRERNLFKSAEYLANYGGEPEKLWATLCPAFPEFTLAAATGFLKQWFSDHPAIKRWQLNQVKLAEKLKYVEASLSGRREHFHDKVDRNKVLNFPIQSFAGDLMNRAIIGLEKELDWEEEAILFQVHDSLVLEVNDIRRGAQLLKKYMEQEIAFRGQQLIFPIDLEIGTDWGNLAEVDYEDIIDHPVFPNTLGLR